MGGEKSVRGRSDCEREEASDPVREQGSEDVHRRAAVADHDDVLALNVDAVIPLGGMEDASFKVLLSREAGAARRALWSVSVAVARGLQKNVHIGNRKSSACGDEDVAGLGALLSSPLVLDVNGPQTVRRPSRIENGGLKDDVVDLEIALHALEVCGRG